LAAPECLQKALRGSLRDFLPEAVGQGYWTPPEGSEGLPEGLPEELPLLDFKHYPSR